MTIVMPIGDALDVVIDVRSLAKRDLVRICHLQSVSTGDWGIGYVTSCHFSTPARSGDSVTIFCFEFPDYRLSISNAKIADGVWMLRRVAPGSGVALLAERKK